MITKKRFGLRILSGFIFLVIILMIFFNLYVVPQIEGTKKTIVFIFVSATAGFLAILLIFFAFADIRELRKKFEDERYKLYKELAEQLRRRKEKEK